MKKKSMLIASNLVWLIATVFCVGLFAAPETSSQGKTMGLGLEAGYVMPSEDNLGNAPAFGLSFFYSFSKQFRVELKGCFFPTEAGNDPEGLSAGTLNVIPLQLSLQYRLGTSGRFIPYVGAGVGYYLNNFSVEKSDQWQNLGFDISEEVDSVFGYHFGAGIDYFIKPNMAVNIDVRYSIASYDASYSITEEVSGISHSGNIEGDINYLSLGAGIKFLF
ncbi:OmpW family protein [Acidobacteriota bacterium]